MKKIIIVGAGIIGMLTAKLLAEENCQVILIEQGYAGKESTWAGGGIISPLYPWRYNDAVTQLALWGQQHYPQLFENIHQDSGINPEYTRSGLLYLDIEDELEQASTWMNKFNYDFAALSTQQIFSIEPSVNSSTKQAWYTDCTAQVRNPRLVRAMRKLMQQHPNITLYEQTHVKKFINKHNIIQGVSTQQQDFYADQVIIAGGAWSANLLSDSQQIPKIAPVKGQMIVFKAKPGLVKRIILSQGRYIIPRQDGRIVLGSTLEFNDFDKSTDQQTQAELRQQAIRIVPALADYPIEKQWAGLRPGSIDGVPYIGEHPEFKNLYINAGHFRNGVVIGYASCELLKNIILEEKTIVDPSPYQLASTRLVKSIDEINLQGAI